MTSSHYTGKEETKSFENSERIYFDLRNGNCSIPDGEVEKEATRMGLQSLNMEKFVPTGIVRMQLAPDLVELLQANETFATREKEPDEDDDGGWQWEDYGFWGPFKDGPQMPKTHIYHEGYFHASPSTLISSSAKDENQQGFVAIDAPIESMNPRFANEMLKPAAPRSFRAFLFAFKKVNEKWIKELLEKLELPFLTFDNVFADVAAQSHYGTEVKVSPDSPGGWHWDAPNSLLHLAVSLHGRRYLHFQHHVPVTEAASSENSEAEITDTKTVVNTSKKKTDWADDRYCRVENTAGCVYLTSPSSFKHAVEYPECDYQTRILAIQCRTLLDTKNTYRDLFGKVDWAAKDKIVGDYLRNYPDIRLPTTQEVVSVLEEIEKLHHVDKKDAGKSSCIIA